MKNIFYILTISLLLYSPQAKARPVSYPDGWTLLLENNADANSTHIHYSPTASTSIGYKFEHLRDADINMHLVQMNNLLKRWNQLDSQANFYLKSGIGQASINNGKDRFTAFTGIAADWEDRRYFISYENKYMHIENTKHSNYKQSARLGWAPYEGGYGDIHTWLMLQIDHKPKDQHNFTTTPLVRFFKDVHLAEIGMNNHGKVLLNYIFRY